MFKKCKINLQVIFFIFIFIFFSISVLVEASTTDGVILDTNKTAFLCKDTTCTTIPTSASRINFKPTNVTTEQEIHITSSGITGYAWSEDMGWINMDPTQSGVVNDGSGILSGYAWGQNAGWINFKPTNGGVVIGSDGKFNGYAWAQNYGWIKFDCTNANSCVETDWRADSGNDGGDVTGGETYTFCELHPSDPSCVVPPPPTFCELHPTDQSCIITTPTFCELHPTDPSCVVPPPPSFCELHPTDPSCVEIDEPTFCESNPSDPSCVGVEDDNNLGEDDNNDGNSDSNGDGNILNEVGIIINDVINLLNTEELNTKIKDVAENTKQFIESEKGEVSISVVGTAGAISGATLSFASILFANPLAFSELFFIPLRLWSLLLAALGIRKKSRPWGTVYDSVTKQPLDPAYVVLNDLNGNEVATSITDLDGRYGFLVPAGQYRLIANKTNYEFPSIKMLGKTSDELYQDLYFGDILDIKEGEVITKNIPLDPIKFDWNEFAKRDQKLMKFYSKRDLFVARFSNILFVVGFILTSISVLSTPKTYNIIIFLIYVLLYFLKKTVLKRKPFGYLTYAFNGHPISFAIIRIYSSATDHEIIHKVADKTGKYYCLVPNGTYYVKIDRKNEDGSYTTIHKSENIEVKDGYISKKFKI